MTRHITEFTIITLLSLIPMAIISCGRHSDAWEKLNLAEQLMETKPDSALSVIDAIKSSSLRDNEEEARYAILKSMALDKNYIDTTTFDIINPAVDYYAKHGSPTEKFRTYYYLGRIYQNQGNDDSAMEQFMNAADLKNDVKDSTLLAHNLVAMGTLYYKQYKINKFIETNMEAAKLYGKAGKGDFVIKSYTNAIDGYTMLHDKATADSIMSICMPLVKNNPGSERFLFSSVLIYTIEFGTTEEINAFLNKYRNLDLSQNNALDFAWGYSKIGEHEKAIDIVSNTKIGGNILDSLKYLSVKAGIFEKQGDYK